MGITKLPKWAQEHIRKIERERETAVDALNKYVDSQTPSAFSIQELECTGENPAPSFKTRYISTNRMTITHRGIELNIYITDGDRSRSPGIHLQWSATKRGMSEVAMVPTSFNAVALITKEDMR